MSKFHRASSRSQLTALSFWLSTPMTGLPASTSSSRTRLSKLTDTLTPRVTTLRIFILTIRWWVRRTEETSQRSSTGPTLGCSRGTSTRERARRVASNAANLLFKCLCRAPASKSSQFMFTIKQKCIRRKSLGRMMTASVTKWRITEPNIENGNFGGGFK